MRRPPICGIASISAPFLGIGIAAILLVTEPRPLEDHAFSANEILAFLALFFGLIAGTLLGGIGIYREEKYPLLPRIGFLLSAIPLVAALILAR